MRALIAEETALPRAFHIPTPTAGQFDDLNEAIINALIQHIDWKSIEAKINLLLYIFFFLESHNKTGAAFLLMSCPGFAFSLTIF